MQNKTLWVLVALIVIVGLGFFWWSTTQAPVEEVGIQGAATATPEFIDNSKDGGAAVSANTIRYGADGFSPSTLTVKVGTSVTFVNQSGEEMWVASDEHPTHTGYDGTNRDSHCPNMGTSLDQCGAGLVYTFIFDKAGTWGFHNHKNPDQHGSIVVTE